MDLVHVAVDLFDEFFFSKIIPEILENPRTPYFSKNTPELYQNYILVLVNFTFRSLFSFL
jgi:hypothetical protein